MRKNEKINRKKEFFEKESGIFSSFLKTDFFCKSLIWNRVTFPANGYPWSQYK